jgi:glycosyltransferase involved in cell wall biosynthesis
VPGIIHSADILLVPLRDIPLFETFIPSKMFEFLGAGGVVVGSVAGEAAEILRSAGAAVVPPEQPTALAEAIRELGADAERRERQAVEGRKYVEQHYDRRMLARRYLALLQRTVRS